MPNCLQSGESGLVLSALYDMKSSGESLGTEVTIAVPIVIETVLMGSTYTLPYLDSGASTSVVMSSLPSNLPRQRSSPCSPGMPWKAMLCAACSPHTNTSPGPTSYSPYVPVGSTYTLVCPYIVSGRSVAATRKTAAAALAGSLAMADASAGVGVTTRSLTSVYSWGLTPSPDCLS